MDLDLLLQQLADLRQARDASEWGAADLMALALAGLKPRKRGRGTISGQLASMWGCSTRWVERMAQVATLFPPNDDDIPDTHYRLPDVPFSRYAACAQAENPRQALAEALEHDLTVRQIEDRVRGVPAGARCPTCGQLLRKKHKDGD